MKHRHLLVALGAVSLIVLGACSSDDAPTTASSSATTPTTSPITGPAAAATTTTSASADSLPASTAPLTPQPAKVTFGDASFDAEIAKCVQVAPGAVSVNGYGTNGSPRPTLVANIANPISASTFVYTTIGEDNSYTTYSMASAVGDEVITGGADGMHVSLSGKAVKQANDPKGAANGDAVTGTLALDGTCPALDQPTPAPTAPTAGADVGAAVDSAPPTS